MTLWQVHLINEESHAHRLVTVECDEPDDAQEQALKRQFQQDNDWRRVTALSAVPVAAEEDDLRICREIEKRCAS